MCFKTGGLVIERSLAEVARREPKNYEEKDAAVLKAQEAGGARGPWTKFLSQRWWITPQTYSTWVLWGPRLSVKWFGTKKKDAVVLDAMLERGTETAGLVTGYAARPDQKPRARDWVSRQIERLKARQNYSPESMRLTLSCPARGSGNMVPR